MAISAQKYEIRQIVWPATTYIGKRAVMPFRSMAAFFREQYRKIEAELQKKKVIPSGAPCAIYYYWDESKKEADLAAVFPVSDPDTMTIGFEKFRIPEAKAVSTTHRGSYESMTVAYGQLDQYMREHKLTVDLVVEEYLTDPELEKNPDKWVTNIYFISR